MDESINRVLGSKKQEGWKWKLEEEEDLSRYLKVRPEGWKKDK